MGAGTQFLTQFRICFQSIFENSSKKKHVFEMRGSQISRILMKPGGIHTNFSTPIRIWARLFMNRLVSWKSMKKNRKKMKDQKQIQYIRNFDGKTSKYQTTTKYQTQVQDIKNFDGKNSTYQKNTKYQHVISKTLQNYTNSRYYNIIIW